MTIQFQNIFSRVLNKDVMQDNLDANHTTSFISSMFTGRYRRLSRSQSYWALWALGIVTFVAYLTAKIGGFAVDDLQLWVFPIVVFLLWFLPIVRIFSALKFLIITSLVLWILSTLYINGVFSSFLPQPQIIAAKIEGDPEGIFRAELLRNIKGKKRERGLAASIGSVYADFTDYNEAHRWLENASKGEVIFFGNTDWVQLLLSDKRLRSFVPGKMLFSSRPSSQLDTWLVENATMLGLDLSKEVIVVHPSGVSFPLLISFNADYVNLPLNPLVLATQYLSVLTAGLADNIDSLDKDSELELATRRSWFVSAASVYGRWKSNGALGFAWFLAGNFDLFRGFIKQEQQGDFICAGKAYGAAASKAVSRFDPSVVAAIFNNDAIVSFLSDDQGNNYPNIEKSLLLAINTFNPDGTPTRGARVALLNLMIFKKMGIL